MTGSTPNPDRTEFSNPHDPTDPEPWGPAEDLPAQAPVARPEAATPTPAPKAPRRRGFAKPLAIGIAVVALLGAGWTAFGLTRPPVVTTVAGQFSSIDVNSSDTSVKVRFDDVTEARIVEQYRGRDPRLEQRVVDGRLEITYSSGPSLFFGPRRLEIVLPRTLEGQRPDLRVAGQSAGVDIEGEYGAVNVTVQSGAIDLEGRFESVQAKTGSGSVDVEGTGPTISAESGSGSIDLKLQDARNVSARSGSGSVDVEVSGPQPDKVDANTQSGSVDVDLPDGRYNITTKTGSGSQDIELEHDPNSRHELNIETGSGSIDVK